VGVGEAKRFGIRFFFFFFFSLCVCVCVDFKLGSQQAIYSPTDLIFSPFSALGGSHGGGDPLDAMVAAAGNAAAADPSAPGSVEEVKALRDRLARSKKRLDENKEVISALQEQVASLKRDGRSASGSASATVM
jgi:hypothetical protein